MLWELLGSCQHYATAAASDGFRQGCWVPHKELAYQLKQLIAWKWSGLFEKN